MQSTPTNAGNSSAVGGSNSNLLASSSTPIRITASGSKLADSGGSGAGDSTNITHSNVGTNTTLQQSSSVPTVTGSHMQLQTPTQMTTGASNQSLGVSVGAGSSVSGISITPPNSAGLRQSSGITNWASDNRDGNLTDKAMSDASKLNRKESYKAQRKNYRREKKRVASELMNSLQDPAVIVLADWLKVRGTLKSWTKLWCVLKPGLLLIYKSPKTKSSHWVGTVMLTSCQVIERPSKKDGFCFKLFHPLEQSIWAPRGPDRETIGAVVQPLPTAYLIFRAPSQAAGKCWMDALELSLRCSALLLRSNSSTGPAGSGNPTASNSAYVTDSGQISHETQWSEADYAKHFNEHDLDADSQNEGPNAQLSGLDTDSDSDAPDGPSGVPQSPYEDKIVETRYVPLPEEDFGGDGDQIEELAEENKSLLWVLVKQVRPGMDLSKVVLPTFILEPRSFLDKLCDSYYHADILSQAVVEDDPLTRMKIVTKWYLSGFYKKPKGLKKPYNPILGETFRCNWAHPNGSRTYYIAEQVSHHPPVSAFYVTNRQEGFSISCTILAKSKFYGNSTSAVLEGVANLTLLPRGESYTMTTPYAHCKGILMGTLSMELGGTVAIECENTGYKTELEFKLKPFMGGVDSTNLVSGKIKLGKETMSVINGRWDADLMIRDTKASKDTLLFSALGDTKSKRLMRYVVPLEDQYPTESERLWHNVSQAILDEDQELATEEKTKLEEDQRNAARDRLENEIPYEAKYFVLNEETGEWFYRYADLRPWDQRNDLKQYEYQYQVKTKTRQMMPNKRTNAIQREQNRPARGEQMTVLKRLSTHEPPLALHTCACNSDSSQSPDYTKRDSTSKIIQELLVAIDTVNMTLDHQTRQLNDISARLDRLQYAPPQQLSPQASIYTPRLSQLNNYNLTSSVSQNTLFKTLTYVFTGLVCSLIIRWMLR